MPTRARDIGRRTLLMAASLALFGCFPAKQPESAKSVAGIEIVLRSPTDRADLLAMLHRHAAAGGLHVDDVSEAWQALGKGEPDPGRLAHKSIHVGLWRGAEDRDLEVRVDDGGAIGRPWITFSRGEHPVQATQLREGLLRDLRHRWPDAMDVPVLPGGGFALRDDMVATRAGYRIRRSEASRYKLPPASPLIATD